ncbi:MAG: hypothetical protein VX938_02770, partial [Myxococcota bacterium]|nr:hypothetical protein [Myxococcota bacterium]
MADEPDNDQTVSMEVPSELIAAESTPLQPLTPVGVSQEEDDESLPDVVIQPDSVDPLGSTMQTGAVTREMVEAAAVQEEDPDETVMELDALEPPRTRPEAIAVAPATRPEALPVSGPITVTEPSDEPQRADTRRTVTPPSKGGGLRILLFITLAIAGTATAWHLSTRTSSDASSALSHIPADADVVGLVRAHRLRESWAGDALQRRLDQLIADMDVGRQSDSPIRDILPGLNELALGALSSRPGHGLVAMTGDFDRAALLAKLQQASSRPGAGDPVTIGGSPFYGGRTMLTGFVADGSLLSGHKDLIEGALTPKSAGGGEHPALTAAAATIDTSSDVWLSALITEPTQATIRALVPPGLGDSIASGDRLAVSLSIADPTVLRAGVLFTDPIRAKKAKTGLDTVVALARATHAAASALGKPVEDDTGSVLDRIETELNNEVLSLSVALPMDVARHLLDRGLSGNLISLPTPPMRPPAHP